MLIGLLVVAVAFPLLVGIASYQVAARRELSVWGIWLFGLLCTASVAVFAGFGAYGKDVLNATGDGFAAYWICGGITSFIGIVGYFLAIAEATDKTKPKVVTKA